MASDADLPAGPEDADAEADRADRPPSVASGSLGPMKVAVLVAAVAFLAASIGWAIGSRPTSPLNDADVGFMQDMGVHHGQAIEMSLLLVDKDDVNSELKHYAQEIIMSQRFDQGVFNATLDRFGHSSDPGDTVMEWMGHPMAPEAMTGLATPEQIVDLRAAEGADAEALWIALMSRHHLGGIEMAQGAVEQGYDRTTVNMARAGVKVQRDEVFELSRYRDRQGLPIPEGFTDPLDDELMTVPVPTTN